MSRAKAQRALVSQAHEYLEELEGGDVDDAAALQTIDEYLAASDAEHVDVREALEAARAGLSGERRRRSAARRERVTSAPAAKPASRAVAPGTKPRSEADRLGGEPPFELTYAFEGELRRISTLRAHMRFFFRVSRRALLDDLRALHDELVARSGPFTWLEKTTSRLYGAATASSLARARERFTCPGVASCHIGLKHSELADDVAERRLDVSIHPRGATSYRAVPSSLHLTFAAAAMDDDFRDRFVALCSRLPELLCGTAGYFLDTTQVRPVAASRIMDAALANPGLELPGTMSFTKAQPSWISGVNWLTAIGAGARKALGAELEAPSIAVHRAGDAIVLQAGRRPELGRDGVSPDAYRRVHAYLERPSTLVGLPIELADPRANAWHRRHLA